MAETPKERGREGHFTDEAWADFARQRGEPEQMTRLKRHLDAGCGQCAQTLGVWTAVIGVTGREASYEPPDEVVTQMKARFARQRPPRLAERTARSVRLIFDSFRRPALAGVRAARGSAQQLLYKAGRYLIRLQIERATDAERLAVVGQIVDEANPRHPLPDLPVLLLNQEETLARTLTNRLGEFQMESVPSESLRLSVGIPEIGTLTLPGRLSEAGAVGSEGISGTRGGVSRRARARHV